MKKTVYYAVILSAVSIVTGLVAGVSLERANIKRKLGLMRQMPYGREAAPDKTKTPQDIFKRITDELNLSEEQRGKVREILGQAREKITLLGSESREKIQAIRQESNAGISGMLTPEQKVKFQKIVSEAQKNHQKFGRRFGGQFGQSPHRQGLPGEPPPPADIPDNLPAEIPQN